MPPRKRRVPVVFDTNVIIGFYLSRRSASANRLVFRLWRDQRKVQLIISDELAEEYLEVLSRLQVPQGLIERFEERLARRKTVTRVRLGPRPKVSRDPDDNLVVATALAGKAQFLVTNDQDLLEIEPKQQARLRLMILTPNELLVRFGSGE